MTHSDQTDSRAARANRESIITARLQVHPDVAENFIGQAIKDGATVPRPAELDGAFRLALQWAYARMGGDVRRF